MALFKVEEIINGNTIKVLEGWKWNGYLGKIVKVEGYSVPDNDWTKTYTESKLKNLLEGKAVELKSVSKVDKDDKLNDNVIFCHVFLNEIDISTYFEELELL